MKIYALVLLRRVSKYVCLGIITQCIIYSFVFASKSEAQNAQSVYKVEIELNHTDIMIRDLLQKIEAETDYVFAYDKRDINTKHTIKVSGRKNKVADLLLLVAETEHCSFKQINNNIFIHRNAGRRNAPQIDVQLQTRTITGKVIGGENDEPLPGVNVLVKGTTHGTVTDVNGQYTIEVGTDEKMLIFSYIGYTPEEINIGERSVVDIVLSPDVKSLEEIVVIGYGTQKRGEITSSVSSVQAEEFNAGGVRSPMDLIQGKVAGLNITRTQGNNPNSSASLQLRGVTSLEGTTEPLVVIDGIPGGDLDLLKQDDIESIDVLKDGSAAAIYGTRGNAGVILITTKKGKGGEPQFEYNTYFQRESVDKRPDNLTASEYRKLIDEGMINASQDYGASTDLFEELIDKDNLSQYHNFVASGGSEKTNYRASLFYNDANGIAKQNGREEFGGRFNINQKGVGDRLEMQINLATNFNKANLLGGSTGYFKQAIQWNPTYPIYNEDGTFFETQTTDVYNPLSRLANRLYERNQQTFSGDARLSFEVLEGLSISAFGAYVRDNYNDRNYRSMNDWDQREDSEYQGMGYAYKENNLKWSNTFESTIDYQKSIGDHSFAAMVGYSYQYSTNENFWVENNGYTTDAFEDWNLGAGSAINNDQLPRPGMGSEKYDNTLIAFFGRINYSYKGKYYAQAVLRHEGSSRFGENNKWGDFPAFSLGWTLSEEAFMQDISFVNNLKLRVGYGVTGNQDIPNYQSLVTLSTGGVYPQNAVYYQTYGAARNPNPNLRWEKKKEWNFGLDYAILDNKIQGSIDIYNRLTSDLLNYYNAPQPPYVKNEIFTNVGALRNKGVEFMISATPVQKQAFQWDVTLTASWQKNKLEKLSSELFEADFLEFGGLPSTGNLGNTIRLEEGGAVGNFYGKRFAGFTEDGEWLFYKADGSVAEVEDMNEDDLTIIGNGVPKYNAALSNTFRYKNFDLTFLFRGKFDFDILNTKEMYFGNTQWLPNNVLKSAVTKHAELDDDPQYSDYYLEKGDFVKLDNVTLGYNFQFKTQYIRHLRVYFTGRNLLTITGYSGIDPELQDTGFDTGIDGVEYYPRTKSWTLGLSFGF